MINPNYMKPQTQEQPQTQEKPKDPEQPGEPIEDKYPIGQSNEPTREPQKEPTQEPRQEPQKEPTQEPIQEPQKEPTQDTEDIYPIGQSKEPSNQEPSNQEPSNQEPSNQDTEDIYPIGQTIENEKIKILLRDKIGCLYVDEKEKHAKYITKLQLNNKILENEWETAKKIKTIPNYPLHFAPILSTEQDIHIGQLDEVIQEECTIIQENQEDQEQPTQISNPEYTTSKIKYVGKYSLQQYINKIKHKYPHKLLPLIIDAHLQLLTAIQKLQEKNLVHMDIKENNILYDENEGRFIIIDFGFTIDTNEITYPTSDKSFFPYGTYTPWAPEIYFLSHYPDDEEKSPESSEPTETPATPNKIIGGTEVPGKPISDQNLIEEKQKPINAESPISPEEKKEIDSIGPVAEPQSPVPPISPEEKKGIDSIGPIAEPESPISPKESPEEETKEETKEEPKEEPKEEETKEEETKEEETKEEIKEEIKEETKEPEAESEEPEEIDTIGPATEPKKEPENPENPNEIIPIGPIEEKTQKIIDPFFESPLFNQIDKQKIIEFQKQTTKFFKATFEKKTKEEAYQTIITYANTWDNYALAVTFIKLIRRFYPTNQPHLIESYINILYDIILALPSSRPQTKDTQEKIKQLFTTITPEDYKELLESEYH